MKWIVLFFVILAVVSSTKVLVVSRQRNVPGLIQTLRQISDIKSPKYGKWLSVEEVKSFVATRPGDLQKIQAWLRKNGATTFEMVETGDAFYTNVEDTKFLQTIPAGLEHLIDDIVIMKDYKSWITNNDAEERVEADNAADDFIRNGPALQRKMYGIPQDLVASNPDNSQMVWGPGTFGSKNDDTQEFFSQMGIGSVKSDIMHIGFPGDSNGDNFIEGSLDTQYITAMGTGVRTYVFNNDIDPQSEWSTGFEAAMMHMTVSMSGADFLPPVLSISLGSLTLDSCNILCDHASEYGVGTQECFDYVGSLRQVCMFKSGKAMDRMNTEYAKITARGTTVLAATGDGGSHYSFRQFDSSRIGDVLNKIACSYQLPTFPSESPYVTAVGGMYFKKNDEGKTIASTWRNGGGGFSWRFEQPWYQRKAVASYLQRDEKVDFHSFNKTMRAYPDVSAAAWYVPLYVGKAGKVVVSGGTSASTPAFAGVLSMINEVRLNKGLPSLGFFNPRLYATEMLPGNQGFVDIADEIDINPICPALGFSGSSGFRSLEGWDAATGFGYPDYEKFVKYYTQK
eukprot:TRINITY_DN4300_c0_g1_i1.p1 TRINITY_DN4300_c0_g1~~TRINITY_DN4300_c0_g1_i1.p1  ORF type:complete len:581 (+),score=192.63 TRINITY_DN4300_c0_g1_i1:44-1744(+)